MSLVLLFYCSVKFAILQVWVGSAFFFSAVGTLLCEGTCLDAENLRCSALASLGPSPPLSQEIKT